MSNIDLSTTVEEAWTNTNISSASKVGGGCGRRSRRRKARAWEAKVPQLLVLGLVTVVLLGGGQGGGTSSNGPLAGVSAEGNIGCLFAETLCIEHLEWCYDDFAFGKCLPQYGLEPEELFRDPLDEDQSRFLAIMLEDLQGAGIGWEHPFTQCRMQGALFAMRSNSEIPRNLCANLAPDPEVLGPQSPLAFVRFTPPNDEYADEMYYPPLKKSQGLSSSSSYLPAMSEKRFYPSAIQPHKKSTSGLENYPETLLPLIPKYLHTPIVEDMEPVALPVRAPLTDLQQTEQERSTLHDFQNRAAFQRMLQQFEASNLPRIAQPYPASPDVTDYLDDPTPNEIKHFHLRIKPQISLNEKRDHSIFKDQKSDTDDEKALKKLVEKLTPIDVPDYAFINQKSSSFREYANKHHIPKISNFAPENVNNVAPGKENPNLDKFFTKSHHHNNDISEMPLNNINEDPQFAPSEAGLYTEGGFVYVPKPGTVKGKNDARALLDNILGFTRHERLDVKKPGPPAAPPPSAQSPNELPKEAVPNEKQNEVDVDSKRPKSKKELHLHMDDNHAPHSVDTEYAHVNLKNPIDNWKDGARIVTALAELLNMQGYFTHPRVDRHEVSFRVEPNPDKKTAAEVAKQINDSRVRNNLSRRFGVMVTGAGVGDKTKEDSVSKERSASEGPDVTHVMAFMFAAGAAAIIVIVITLFLIKKHDKKKDKLGGLQTGLLGADSCSKDYQDLCRARMAGKNGSNDSPGGRITALAKETERPPSSRSSTSSWSEEPALTNMDISTGHMVLSYMEDHLRNKGRLQREWEALCRYEAEPSARDAALQQQCAALNRPGAPLPYDHSRVVLNHLANAEGMDYINASTIFFPFQTDHDPRAPAYVAAQGPMQSTLAHFWQMVWEQGAVVLVALCRLQENGETACARYWPEEGAEVYHIYEVHLVSEHIWCDDYLVRSFYLKNLRTGETRTVTQFHFLSWPLGGVPTSAKALLDFRRKVNKSYRGRSCPIVVHSSNGSGRTGAYILLDLVLGRMNKGAREIDIAATLEHLRDQRAGLVATRQQFEFVLMAVAEEVHAILKALPQNAGAGEKRPSDPQQEKEATLKEEKEAGTSSKDGEGKSKEKAAASAQK
ncbi:receptor-type tyrosine-protein phosphatase-like N isoform X2 [Uranotaenia lowii]|uniref:receptor-type tyrosine-protein phosphatase-like N isoform X2 n=1 Tax=Uranotaenia lowii TaxID=190385 RepID=UPI0024786AE1|nr:receptor-type tyrosine-protein phosphatase-like N isoform X2 [Uranotaenia lowii]